MTETTLSPAGNCRPRSVVVAEVLPELLAAYATRDDLRRSGGSLLSELSAATDRLDRARTAIRGC